MRQKSDAKVPVPEHVEAGERSHAEIMVIMSALMLGMLLAALDQTIVATALPRIASDLNGLNRLSWVATAYLLTSAISTPLYGKISDMYGRKKIFQTSIIIFLIGSALCGLSQSMGQLIFFRGLQGLGAGGLMTLALAIIGDVVSPRQRGRYQGYFGAVFGVSSIAGPLLGGFFTDHLSWRWIFYINLPLGILALTVIAARLHLPVHKTEHKIDFLGAGLLAISVASLLLATVWGGTDYGWGSKQIIGLISTFVVAGLLFVLREQRATEPIIPLKLFRNDIFSVSVLLSLLAGVGMFGAIIFLPEYQQIVHGESATKSGLLLLPLIGGLLISVVGSGRLVTKFGHYRPFPIFGTLIMAVGFWLFSHVAVNTSQVMLSLWMIVLGLGMGSFLQIMTVAVQNSVDRKDLGTATSVVLFFRNIGSSLGAAIFGAVLTARLGYHLKQLLPAAGGHAQVSTKSLQAGANQIHKLPPNVQHLVLEAFARSFHDIFLIGIPFSLMAFLVALFLREKPLSTSTKQAPVAVIET
jgi:EmrB/QacA subfamily drug resistance transporter